MSNLVDFAKRELDMLLAKCEDDEARAMQQRMNDGVLEIVKTFSNAGHSGFSANYALGLINRLLNWKPISELTGEDDEWEKLDYGEDISFQNKRCPSVFKNAEGRAYCVDAKMFSDDNGKTWFTSRDSTVEVKFPYTVSTYPEQVLIDNKVEREQVLGEIYTLMQEIGFTEEPIEFSEETEICKIFSTKNYETLESKIQNKYNITGLLFKVSEANYIWELVNLVLKSNRGD